MQGKGQLFFRGLLISLLVLGGAVTASAIGYSEFAQVYYGADTYIHILGEELELPVLEMTDQTMTVDVSDVTYGDRYGYGVLFEYDDSELTDAAVTLDNGSLLDVTLETEELYFELTGVGVVDFAEAHVSLLGGSEVNVDLRGYCNASATGVVLGEIFDPKTASLRLDDGSSVSVYAEIEVNPAGGYNNVEAVGVELSDDAHAKVDLDNGSQISAEVYVCVEKDGVDTGIGVYADATGVAAEGELVDVTLTGGSQISAEAAIECADTVTSSTTPSTDAVGIDAAGAMVNVTLGGNSVVSASAVDPDNADACGTELYGDEVNLTLTDSKIIATAESHDKTNLEADADAYGVELSANNAVVTLTNSTLSATANATGEEDSDAEATGISAYGDTVEIKLLEGSSVNAKATADCEAESVGIDVGFDSGVEVNHAEVHLDGASSVSSIAIGAEGSAKSMGVVISADGDETAILTLKNGSTVSVTASATALDSASYVAAQTSTVGLGMFDSEVVEVTLNDATLNISASAASTQNGVDENAADADAEILESGGVAIIDYGSAMVSLTDTVITLQAQATATSTAAESGACISFEEDFGLTGLLVAEGNASTIALQRTAIDVTATATAGDAAAVFANGINLYATGDDTTLQLTDSTLNVFATATATADGGESIALAAGIGAAVQGENALIALDNTTVTVVADADQGGANGIFADSGEYTINLTNGSQITALQSAGMLEDDDDAEGLGSVAIYVEDAEAEINVDSTSSLHGDWAVYTDEADANLSNAGLIAGRLNVDDLNNSATGVLQATFASDDAFAYADSSAEEFYFMAEIATLTDGTTFRLNPTDSFGLAAVGDERSYALLEVDGEAEGVWTQANLNLSATTASPMLGLSWHEDSGANQLIATTTFLSPTQAGLSANGTAAFYAAMADGLFDFETNPEEWVPNVSGAFIAGMAQTLGTSHHNVGKRLGALMGMNSGDEIVASNGMWFSIRFTEADQSKRDSTVGFEADTTGLTIGYDREFGDTILGFAYTRGNTDADVDDNNADFDMSDNLFSLYGSYDGGNWYTEAILSAGFGSVDGVRYVATDAYESDYDSTSYNAKVEVGMKFGQQGWQVNPLLAMEYSAKDYDSYTETGSGNRALHVKSQDYDVFTMGAGAVLQKDFQLNWGTITPEASGMINYDISNDRVVSTANFVGGSTSFVAKGIEPSETSWDLGAALTVASFGEQNVSLRLGYDYSGRQDFEAHSFTGKVRFEF